MGKSDAHTRKNASDLRSDRICESSVTVDLKTGGEERFGNTMVICSDDSLLAEEDSVWKT